ncbi:GNAT family N-acetyltransferase [Actinocorallia longicatena]|uniref:GNAT family N-acetyltransferase n=1 Tax=Actinocorallia longicatena TaxID=111803 RepID=A0ABP6QIQ5_9ACTN
MSVPETIDLGDFTLRRWTADRAEALHEAVRDSFPSLHPWMPWAAAPATIADQVEYLTAVEKSWEAGEAHNYAILDGERVIGSIGLMNRVGPGATEIGYWLRTGATGRGVVTRAVTALIAVARADLAVARVEIHCDELNLRSAAVPQRLGFTLARTDTVTPEAPSETGRLQIWTLES